jgi:SAM-dependent methyltransferase
MKNSYLKLCSELFDLRKPFVTQIYNFYKNFAVRSNGMILEPMCGTGRYLIPMLEEGLDIYGFDSSIHMIEKLIQNAKSKKLNASSNVWQGSIQDLNLNKKFKLVFIPHGSFSLITDEEEIKKSLIKINEHLDKSGIFLLEIEFYNRDEVTVGVWRSKIWNMQNGSKIKMSHCISSNSKNYFTCVFKYELIEGHNVIETQMEETTHKIYEHEDTIKLLENCGFKDISVVKAYEENKPPEEKDSSFVYVIKKVL